MGLFNKNTAKNVPKVDDEDTINASELLAINQEAARKEKLARKALMEKAESSEDEIEGIEFEATTSIENVSSLLDQANNTNELTETGINLAGLTSKEHMDDVIGLKETILKMKFEQRFENQQFKEQLFKMLAPFEKSKNPNIRKHIQKIKKVIHDFTKDKA